MADLEPHRLDGQFEEAAEAVARHDPNIPLKTIAEVSLAISLKRIAEALDGTTAGVDISESLCGGRPNQFRHYG